MKRFKDTRYGDLTGQVYEGNIYVYNQDLDSLEGAPKVIHGGFICLGNNLKNLKGAPREVYGNFDCSNNKKLETLEGAPKIVNGDFKCKKCPKLTSLDGLLNTEISRRLESNIITDKEFSELQDLYNNEAGKNMKKYKLLKKLKDIK